MILKYNTEKLPPNFIYLGMLLFPLGIWRMVVLDWKGILFFILSLLFLFIRSGIVIDTDNRRIKKHTGFFAIRKGKWESIQSVISLKILKTKETQTMSVLSITRIETYDVYKLLLTLPNNTIELMSGKKEDIIKRAEKISSSLQVSLENKTK